MKARQDGNGRTRRPVLPRLLVALDGRAPWSLMLSPGVGVLLQDLDLSELVEIASTVEAPLALNLDSVEGMTADESSVAFVFERLGIDYVISRRAAAVAYAAASGRIGLLHTFALDSTGLERAIAGHPRAPGAGTAISPGVVLPYLGPEELTQLPRPLLAYGLLRTPVEVTAALRAGAQAVVVTRELAVRLKGAEGIDMPPDKE